MAQYDFILNRRTKRSQKKPSDFDLACLKKYRKMNSPLYKKNHKYQDGYFFHIHKGNILMRRSMMLSMLCFALTAILIAGCVSPRPGGQIPPVSPVVTTITVSQSACGITSCHGLNLACGPNPPEVCTAIYQIGDKCRQYAYCSTNGGTCSLVTTPQFTTCKACIEKCGGADPAEILSCEEKC